MDWLRHEWLMHCRSQRKSTAWLLSLYRSLYQHTTLCILAGVLLGADAESS